MKRKCRMAVLILGLLLFTTGCHNADRSNVTGEGQEVTDTDLAEEKDDNELADANDEETKENTETDNNDPSVDSQKDDANNPMQAHGALFVKGTQLVDKTGKPFQLRGVSTHGLNWFPEYVNADAFASMKNDWKINCVRLAMYTAEGDSYCEGGNKENLKNIVSQGVEYATDLGLYVIIDWHVLHDLDPNKYKADALAFFDEMSAKYADYDNVIYEICNEPNGGTSWDQIKSYANEVIPVIKKNNPDAVIVAAGCYVQAQADMGELDENIDIVIGNNKKKDLIRLLEEYFKEDIPEQMQEVIDINHTSEYESLHLSRTAEHTRAYLKVQDGCNQFCTYCIIPYARGRVRSRKKEDVVEEVRTLAEHGYQEVVLTGIHLSSYGLEWKDENGKQTEGLLELIRAVHEVEGIKRIRLGSLEPRIVTEEFAKELACLPKICPHFHLSLQSGCDATLKRMNRRYDAAEYREKCELLRKYFENPALTTDVIVGFPQESEEEFEASRDFVDSINFYETHIFKYSKRQGTKAAKMDGQIPEHEKTRRSNILLELNREKMQRYEEGWLGKKVEVLFEEMTERDGKNYVTGYTKEYLRIGVPCEPEQADRWTNQLKEIELTSLSQIMH